MKVVSDSHLQRIATRPVSVIAVDEHNVCAPDEIKWRLREDLSVGPFSDLKEIEAVVPIDRR